MIEGFKQRDIIRHNEKGASVAIAPGEVMLFANGYTYLDMCKVTSFSTIFGLQAAKVKVWR